MGRQERIYSPMMIGRENRLKKLPWGTLENCPQKLRQLLCKIEKEEFQSDEIGLSESQVYLFPNQVLKIQEDNEEARNEAAMMDWLQGRVPAPQVIAHVCEGGRSYLLMTRTAGKMACDEEYMSNPRRLTQMLAEALKLLWRTDITGCPGKWGIERKLSMAEYWVEHDMVSMEDAEPDTYGKDGFRSPKELYGWLAEHKPPEEPVLSHGDFTLPNLIFSGNELKGFIDLGRMGAADKWQDIALCYRSLLHNYDGKYGGRRYEGFRPKMLFEQLGMEPDWEKIRYYILLDELF